MMDVMGTGVFPSGLLSAAESLARRALQIRRERMGSDVQTARSMNQLAAALDRAATAPRRPSVP